MDAYWTEAITRLERLAAEQRELARDKSLTKTMRLWHKGAAESYDHAREMELRRLARGK